MNQYSLLYMNSQPQKRRPKRVHWKIFYGSFEFIKSYCDRSSIHGFAYILHKQLTWFERLVWLVLMGLGFGWCIVLGLQSLERYKTKSTVVGLERDFYFWNTSLPSLTICPMERLDKDKFDTYCRQHNIEGQTKTEFFDFLENLANSTYMNFDRIPVYESVDRILKEIEIKPEQYMELIYNLTFDATMEPTDKIRVRCIDDKINVHVRLVLTEYGLCYMANNFLGDQYTAKYLIFGQYPDLNPYENDKILIQVHKGTFNDMDVGYNFIGFRTPIDLYLHSAFDVMRVDLNNGLTDEGVEYDPQNSEITTDENFEKSATISQRRCRFHHESNLTHFPVYTKYLCQQECRLNLVYETCKCIPHFYPNRIANPKRVCHYRELIECFPQHQNYFLKLFLDEKEKANHNSKPPACYCLQNCRDAVVSIRDSHVMKSSRQLLGSIGGVVSMKVWPTERLKRQVIYSFTDLLVSMGCSSGLFLGVSVLGAIEIVYYFTGRLLGHCLGYKI